MLIVCILKVTVINVFMFLSAFNDYAVVISFSAIIINTLIFIIMFLIATVTGIVNVSIKFVAGFFCNAYVFTVHIIVPVIFYFN